MNERIETLAKAAGYDMINKAAMRALGFDVEKFAELIVKECVAICQDTDGEDNIDARSGRQDCAVEIKEHFGVEE
jgi:hypothetical protein